MSPTAELKWVSRLNQDYGSVGYGLRVWVLQQKWVQHHIPAGLTEAPYEWRDVPKE